MTMSTAGEGFGQLAVIGGLVYGLGFAGRKPSIIRTTLRVAVTGLLAAAAFELIQAFSDPSEPSGRAAGWLVAGLAVSALADGFLSRDGRQALMRGLAVSIAAAACYLVLFASLIDASLIHEPLRIGLAATALVVAGLALRWLWPSLGELKPVVAGYVAIMAAMAVVALFCRTPSWSFRDPWSTFVAAATLLAAGWVLVAHRLKGLKLFGSDWVTSALTWFAYCSGQIVLATLYLII